MKAVNFYKDFMKGIQEKDKAYLLLYKERSENIKTLQKAARDTNITKPCLRILFTLEKVKKSHSSF